MTEDRCRITDGDTWVTCDPVEAEYLVAKRVVHPCMGDCPAGTYHLLETWNRVEIELHIVRDHLCQDRH